jgi:hypothetical protein
MSRFPDLYPLVIMDFVVIPSSRASFGIPQVKGRSWLGALLLVQLVQFVSYQIVTKRDLRILDNPFGCSGTCLPPSFVVLLDWFISSVSVLLPMITDELLFDEFVYFSFHYIYFIRIFLIYRVLLVTLLLPVSGLPLSVVTVMTSVHFSLIFILLRVFYVLLKEIEKSKNSIIAIKLTFRYLLSISFVKVFRSLDGDSVALAPTITQKPTAGVGDICPICYEGLTIGSQRNVTSASRSRVNASITRPMSHGKLNIFTTSCHHSFHRDCIMKVCYLIIICSIYLL